MDSVTEINSNLDRIANSLERIVRASATILEAVAADMRETGEDGDRDHAQVIGVAVSILRGDA